MSSGKPLSPLMKVLIYIGAIVGSILLIFIVCIAVMFFKPGTTILGYQYIKYGEDAELKFTDESDLSITDISAIEIATKRTDIFIYPNDTEGEIKIVHKKGISGFAKAINAELSVKTTKQTKTFEGENANHNTLIYSVDEPSGLLFSSSSSIYLYLPSNIYLTSISAKSNSGNLVYSSKSTQKNNEEVISCENLHLRTGGSGVVTITNTERISNYYLQTGSGAVRFSEVSTLNANSIYYQTNSGTFNYTNANKDATLNLTNGLTIKSTTQMNRGPSIAVNNLNGNLKVDTFNGNYQFTKIGDEGNYKMVTITTNNSRITLGTVYAQVSILSDSENPSNTISVDTLTSPSATNQFEAGAGSVYVKSLSGSSAFNTSSGSIKVDEATANCNVYAHSTTGSIDITFEETETPDKNHKTVILTNTGSVNVRNISNQLNLQILSDSSSTLNLSFCAVAYCDHIIDARTRNMNIVLVGLSDALQHRVACTTLVSLPRTSVGVAGTQILDGDGDTLINNVDYKDKFSYFYRIGYVESNVKNQEYFSWGKVLINTTGTATITTATRVITE